MYPPLPDKDGEQKEIVTHNLNEANLQTFNSMEFAARFKIISKLGRGAFADVLRLRDHGRCDRALKVLRHNAPHPAGVQPEVALFREARALKHASHKNIVQLIKVMRLPNAAFSKGAGTANSSAANGSKEVLQQHGSCWALLLEYMQGGSLAALLYKQITNPHIKFYSNMAALTWAVDIATGLAHLHSLNPVIIHRYLKLENILLQKTSAAAGSSGTMTRRLPVAKLSDFGLHVMLERPSYPYHIQVYDGNPVLVYNGSEEQQQQGQPQEQLEQQQQQHMSATDSTNSTRHGLVGSSLTKSASSVGTPPGNLCSQCGTVCCMSGDSSSSRSRSRSYYTGDEGSSEPAAIAQAAVTTANATSAGRRRQQEHTCKHGGQQQQQQLATAHSNLQTSHSLTDPLPVLCLQNTCLICHQQRQQHSLPLTSSTLCRLLTDSAAGTDRPQSSIPLLLQPPGSKPGSLVSYCKASIPAAALQTSRAHHQQQPHTAAVATRSDANSNVCANGQPKMQQAGSQGRRSSNVPDILAAANVERDYEVSVPNRADSPLPFSLQRTSGGSTLAAQATKATSPFAAVAGTAATPTASPAGGSSTWHTIGTAVADNRLLHGLLHRSSAPDVACQPPAAAGGPASSVSEGWSVSTRSVGVASAGSIIWESMTEDNVDIGLLTTDTLSHPLAYDLTHHTGSCMYMAPEVFRGEPYNEAIDVFSFGVILYELFSRSLLLYTHTPANSSDDSMAYAERVANGFRPACPKAFPQAIWGIVERCWDHDSTARPTSGWVMQQLQQLHKAEEAALAAADAAGAAARGRVWRKGKELLCKSSLGVFGREQPPAAGVVARPASSHATKNSTAAIEQFTTAAVTAPAAATDQCVRISGIQEADDDSHYVPGAHRGDLASVTKGSNQANAVATAAEAAKGMAATAQCNDASKQTDTDYQVGLAAQNSARTCYKEVSASYTYSGSTQDIAGYCAGSFKAATQQAGPSGQQHDHQPTCKCVIC